MANQLSLFTISNFQPFCESPSFWARDWFSGRSLIPSQSWKYYRYFSPLVAHCYNIEKMAQSYIIAWKRSSTWIFLTQSNSLIMPKIKFLFVFIRNNQICILFNLSLTSRIAEWEDANYLQEMGQFPLKWMQFQMRLFTVFCC